MFLQPTLKQIYIYSKKKRQRQQASFQCLDHTHAHKIFINGYSWKLQDPGNNDSGSETESVCKDSATFGTQWTQICPFTGQPPHLFFFVLLAKDCDPLWILIGWHPSFLAVVTVNCLVVFAWKSGLSNKLSGILLSTFTYCFNEPVALRLIFLSIIFGKS